jgi:hypothetical protein
LAAAAAVTRDLRKARRGRHDRFMIVLLRVPRTRGNPAP